MLYEPGFWWLDAMLALWVLFFVMLFILGPIGVLRRIMPGPLEHDMARRLAQVRQLHLVLLTLALITIAGAMAGSHGLG